MYTYTHEYCMLYIEHEGWEEESCIAKLIGLSILIRFMLWFPISNQTDIFASSVSTIFSAVNTVFGEKNDPNIAPPT